jgi:hypothetical protein
MEFTDFIFLYNQLSKRIKFVDEIFIPSQIMESSLNIDAQIDKITAITRYYERVWTSVAYT